MTVQRCKPKANQLTAELDRPVDYHPFNGQTCWMALSFSQLPGRR